MNKHWWFRIIGVFGLQLCCMAVVQTEAAQVVQKFCEMDAEGKQLTQEAWRSMVQLFAATGASPARKIIVVKNFVVSPPEITGNKAELYAEYIYLGEIDRQTGRS